MSNWLKNIILPLVIVVTGFATIIALSVFLDENKPSLPAGYDDQDMAVNVSKFRGFAFGCEGLMADWYWMQSLQYIGGKIDKAQLGINMEDLSVLNPRLLYPYLDTATSLDPHFIAAYSYGAIVLPSINPENAIAITQKGISNNPDEWRLYQHLGYIYWRLKDYEMAAVNYEKGSMIAGSPTFMKLMAASMRTEGGSRDTARSIYRQMLAESTEDQTKSVAELRLKQLDAMDELDAIDRVLSDFKEKNGRCSGSLNEIITVLMTVKLPEGREFRIDDANNLVDPSDAPYLLDKEKCNARLNPTKTAITIK